MNHRPLTIPTMGTPYVRPFMRGHRQFQTLTRVASPNAQSTPAEAGRGKGYSA